MHRLVVITLLGLVILLLATDETATEEIASVAPDFTIRQCVRADSIALSDYASSPVLLFFLDAGDVPCIHAFRYANEWTRRYRNDGLVVLGIHCPQFPPLKIRYNAIEVLTRAKLRFPVGLDMDWEVTSAYAITEFPTFVLLEPGKKIFYRTSGRKKYTEVEKAIQELLRQLKPDIIHPLLFKPVSPLDDPNVEELLATPQLILGYSSGLIHDCDSTKWDQFATYEDPRDKNKGIVYLEGRWKVEERATLHEQTYSGSHDHIRVIYSGKDVWVLPYFEFGTTPRVYIKQDRFYLSDKLWGKDVECDKFGRPYIYMKYSIPKHIVRNKEYGTHELELIPESGDVGFCYFFFEGDVKPEKTHR